MLGQRGLLHREECKFIGSEAAITEPTARYKLQQIACSTQYLNDTIQDSLWTTQKQNLCIAGSPSYLYLENNIRRQK